MRHLERAGVLWGLIAVVMLLALLTQAVVVWPQQRARVEARGK